MNLSNKPTLVLAGDQNLILPVVYQELEKYFNLVTYCNTTDYDVRSTLIAVDCNRRPEHFKKIFNSGIKIVVDSLCEPQHVYKKNYPELLQAWILNNINWFWYRESLVYTLDKTQPNYVPNRTYQYRALMPMNIQRTHRDQLLKAMRPFLDSFIWSYVDNPRIKKQLPDDKPLDNRHLVHDRHFNPDWYNQTFFSLVAETAVTLPNQTMFVTEKTFKPIAFQHPFMIFGMYKTLSYLQNQGFVTFENLFDESYDLKIDSLSRLEKIKNNVENLIITPYDKITQEKIQHNHQHFFDINLIKQKIKNEIIDSLLHYVETR